MATSADYYSSVSQREDGQWYFTGRDGQTHGPFTTECEAVAAERAQWRRADEIEVTPEMIEAGLRAFICDCGATVHRKEVVRIYRAMRALEPRPAEPLITVPRYANESCEDYKARVARERITGVDRGPW